MIYKFSLIEKILLKFDVIPHPVVDSLSMVISGRALQAALNLGLFDVLGEKEGRLDEVAEKLSIRPNNLEIVANCLEALGYVNITSVDQSLRLKLTKRGRTFLSKGSESSLRNTVKFASYIFNSLSELERNLKRGRPRRVNLTTFDEGQWDVFNNAMVEVAKLNLGEVINSIPLNKGYKKVLDLGGSHGLHSIEICRKYPVLQAEIMDLKPVKSFAEGVIRGHKMEHRVKFRVGDVLKDSLGTGYDVILAFNLIHGFNEETNRKLAKKIFDSLNPGGVFVILDQMKDAKGNSDLSKLIYAAQGLMLFNVAGGRTYSSGDIEQWMIDSGFGTTEFKKLKMPGNALIIGYK